MPTPENASEQKVLDDVATYGWHVVNVLTDADGPGFSYTIGLFQSFQHPEILVVGLPSGVAHPVLNELGEAARSGRGHVAGATYDDYLEGFQCTRDSADALSRLSRLGAVVLRSKGLPRTPTHLS